MTPDEQTRLETLLHEAADENPPESLRARIFRAPMRHHPFVPVAASILIVAAISFALFLPPQEVRQPADTSPRGRQDPFEKHVREWLSGNKDAGKRLEELGRKAIPTLLGYRDVGKVADLIAQIEQSPSRILLVDGEPGERFDSETLYFKLALDPEGTGKDYLFRETRAERFRTEGLAKLELVVLANVPRLDADQAGALERFVLAGGSLFVALGDQVDPAAYNQHLWRDGKGVLPAKIGRAAGDPEHPNRRRIGTFREEHPVLRTFRRLRQAVQDLVFTRYYEVEASPDARTIVCLDDDRRSPLLVEKRHGAGRVLLFTTPIDAEWNEGVPGRAPYVVLMRNLTRYLCEVPKRDTIDPIEKLVERWLGGEDARSKIEHLGRKALPALWKHRRQPKAARLHDTLRKRPIRVLLVEHRPRYEYRFLKNALIQDRNMLVHCLLTSAGAAFVQEHSKDASDPRFRVPIDEFPGTLQELLGYDVVILGEIRIERIGGEESADRIAEFVREFGGGLVLLAGSQHNPKDFKETALEGLTPVAPPSDQGIDGPIWKPTDVRFTRTKAGTDHPILRAAWADRKVEDLGEISWFLAVGKVKAGAEVLLEVTANMPPGRRTHPLFVVSGAGRGRVFWSGTDQTWQWRKGTGDEPWFCPLHKAAIDWASGTGGR